eukprot:m.290962 g.290962  ORF g.290962 m.290962 type:complete len:383 (+) comp12383_c0_seq1:181-1329(+)
MFSRLFGGADDGDGAEAAASSSSSSSDFFGSMFDNVKELGNKLRTELDSVVNVVNDKALGEFNREQQAFVRSKNRQRGSAVPPWVGYEDADSLREQILALSKDQRNFLRDPPPGATQYTFDFEHYYPIAMATLQEDPRLQEMRFELVPKQVTEEHFWRNYFYRVSLLKQSSQLSAMSAPPTEPGSDEDSAAAAATDAAATALAPRSDGGSAVAERASDATIVPQATKAGERAVAQSHADEEEAEEEDIGDIDAVSDASFTEYNNDFCSGVELGELDDALTSKSGESSNPEDSDGFTHISEVPRKAKGEAQQKSAGAAAANATINATDDLDLDVVGDDDVDGWDPDLEKELDNLDLDGELADLGDLDGDENWEEDLENMLDEA